MVETEMWYLTEQIERYDACGLIILQLPRLAIVFLHSRWIFKIIYQGAYISIEGNEESFIFLQVDQLDSETMQ